MTRKDFQYPFAIDAASGQAATTDYASHVEQMIQQVLLTDPGERVCLPTFGAGLRRLLFAPMNSSLTATTTLIVQQSLNQWLSNQITVQKVTVTTANSTPNPTAPGQPPPGPPLPDGAIQVVVTYVLTETQQMATTQVQIV
ncbi:MAG: GPW/gp25 family protein [Terracidiphilus sp.]|jgi:phage baseplate assembly protein W